MLENVLCKICYQVFIRGVGNENTCLSGVQTEPLCVDWVDELSQVATTMRTGKAIGVDSIPPEACRVAGRAYLCQLPEIVKQVIKCNRFPDVWKRRHHVRLPKETTRARAVDHLAHRAERCRQAIQQDPDLFPKLETDMQAKLDQQDQQERRKAVKQGKSWLTAILLAVSCKPNCL